MEITRSPAKVAGVALAGSLPWLFLTLTAGALADRHDRRRLMVVADVGRIVLLGGLTASVAVDATPPLAVVYLVSVGLGIAQVIFDTSAQALMPALVDRDDLSKANGRLFAAELVANQFVGPPLGGLLFGIAAAVTFGATAALYVVAVLLLVAITGSFRTPPKEDRTTIRADIGEGVRYLFGHRLLRTLGVLLGIQNLLFNGVMALFVLYAVDDRDGLGLSSGGVGLLFTAGAIGGLLGSFFVDKVERIVGRTRVLLVAVVIGSATMATYGLTRNVGVVAAAGVLAGIAAVMWNVVTVSLRQRIIPDHLLGRVNSGYRLLGWGTMPIGAALAGALGEALGVRPVFVLAGVVQLVVAVPLLLANVNESAMRETP